MFVRDEPGVSRLGDGVRDEPVVQLLRVVDLLPRGNSCRVNVADPLQVVALVRSLMELDARRLYPG